MANPVSVSQKSTTVRTNIVTTLQRYTRRAVETLFPSFFERRTAEQFLTPRRSQGSHPFPLADSFTIDSGRVQLRAWRWGNGPLVLLAHGWEGHAGHLRSFVEPLVARGFGVVAVDLPAHGYATGELTSIVEFADALCAVADAVGPIHAVIAHSFGGAAAALALGPRRPEGRRLKAGRLVLLASPEGPAHFVQGMIAQLGLSPERGARIARRIEALVGMRMADLAVPSYAHALSLPLMLMHDPADRLVPFAHAEAIAAAWPGAQLRPTPGVGHRRILSDAAVIGEVVAFVAGSSIES